MNRLDILDLLHVDDTKLTDFVLKALSRRLSGRADCKHVEYALQIVGTHPQYIQFHPSIVVYPSRFERKNIDKLPVFEYILDHYFGDEISWEHDSSGRIVIKNGCFIPGNYQYQYSVDRKQRRWIKL